MYQTLEYPTWAGVSDSQENDEPQNPVRHQRAGHRKEDRSLDRIFATCDASDLLRKAHDRWCEEGLVQWSEFVYFVSESNREFAVSPAAILVHSDSENADLEKTFNRLAEQWKRQTSGFSSVGSIVMHPAYLEVISYGEKMIPFILKDLQAKPSHWFIALKTLAKNYSPVRPEDAGNIKKMTEAWIEWGKANGKLS